MGKIWLVKMYVQEIVKGRSVFAPGCAGYDDTGMQGAMPGWLDALCPKWYGLDCDREYLRRHNQKGNLYYGDLNEHNWADAIPRDFEVIVMTEVLEHLESPIQTLRYLKRMFPGKKLVVSVPNGGSLGHIILGWRKRRLRFLDRHHLCAFSEMTILNVFKLADVEVNHWWYYCHTSWQALVLRLAPHMSSGMIIEGTL